MAISLDVSSVGAMAFPTGKPRQFILDPVTVRQRDKPESIIAATIKLKAPSPSFFVCEIRSMEAEKISFPNIVFSKGQVEATVQGNVHWRAVLKDCEVKVTAFNTDTPEDRIWAEVVLKTAVAEEQDTDDSAVAEP